MARVRSNILSSSSTSSASLSYSSKKHNTNNTNNNNNNLISLENKENLLKKDILFEEQTIGGFTLIFQDPNMEIKWQTTHLLRQTRLTQRLLFFSSLFQGLFYCSDYIDSPKEYLLLFGSIRLLISLLFLLGSFLVAIGILQPKQRTLCWCQLIYGCPTLAIYFFYKT